MSNNQADCHRTAIDMKVESQTSNVTVGLSQNSHWHESIRHSNVTVGLSPNSHWHKY